MDPRNFMPDCSFQFSCVCYSMVHPRQSYTAYDSMSAIPICYKDYGNVCYYLPERQGTVVW